MLSHECLYELENRWLPNITDQGLDRLIDMLEKGSPLLIHGSFTRAMPMGCLATHIAWNHPQTAHLNMDAGVCWLNRVAGLNPATSHVIRHWDRSGPTSYELRADLLAVLKGLREKRCEQPVSAPRNRVADLVKA